MFGKGVEKNIESEDRSIPIFFIFKRKNSLNRFIYKILKLTISLDSFQPGFRNKTSKYLNTTDREKIFQKG